MYEKVERINVRKIGGQTFRNTRQSGVMSGKRPTK